MITIVAPKSTLNTSSYLTNSIILIRLRTENFVPDNVLLSDNQSNRNTSTNELTKRSTATTWRMV